MPGRTGHYGWNKAGQGDSLSDDGYKFGTIDRDDMDTKVWLGAEGHHHRGGVIDAITPPATPVLVLNPSGGVIPAATRVYYKIALVNTQNQESVASTEAYIDTASRVSEPGAPTPAFTTTGGALLGGDYYYALSAYVGVSTNETKALGTTFLSVNSTTGTNKVTLTLPSTPAGATGFNLYRRAPGEMKYFFLTTIDMSGATPPSTYVDNGSVAENCDRSVPIANTTNSTNAITITYPGSSPYVPLGYTWKIYRTYLNGVWDQSLLHHVVEFTAEATPIITTTYQDLGYPTIAGTPKTSVSTMVNPDKIVLTDGLEVQGNLPMGETAFPFEYTFTYSGVTTTSTGSRVFVCEFPNAQVVAVRASLGRGYSPASQPVIIDVQKGTGTATPTFSSLFATTPERPTIPVGWQVGARTRPTLSRALLSQGDVLTADVVQAGGGASPTDSDLTITVTMIGYGYPATSFIAGTTPTGY